jgi:hypothetical protein
MATGLLLAGCAKTPTPDARSAAQMAPATTQPAAAEAANKEPEKIIAKTGSPNLPGFVRPSGPVATVNGMNIEADRFNAGIDRLVGSGARIPRDRMKRIARNILGKLIDNELRRQSIVREGISLTEHEFETAYGEYTSRFLDSDGRFNESRFSANLKRSGMTRAQLKAQIREQRRTRKLVEKIGNVEVSPEEARQYYGNNPSAWIESESRDVRPIMIPVAPEADSKDQAEAESKAQAAHDALSRGGDFEQISLRFQDRPLAPIHLTRNSHEQTLARNAFALKVGEVSKPIKTRWGWYVIRLIEKNDQRTRPYPEVREEIYKTMRARKFYLEDQRIVRELRGKAEIVEKLPF